jgi:hypothetical protein
VPSGFSAIVASDPRLAKMGDQYQAVIRDGGVLLVEKVRPAVEGGFLASVVIAPIAGQEVRPDDPEMCKSAAAGLSRSTGAPLESQGIVAMQWGKTCQISLGAPKDTPHRGGMFTILRAGKRNWMVTCNFDDRDASARSACASVLADARSE